MSSSTRITRDPGFSLPGRVQDDYDYDIFEDDVELGFGPGSRKISNAAFVSPAQKTDEALARPYLLDATVMTRLKQLLLLGKTSGAFPWSWDKRTHRINRWSPGWEKVWVVVWAFVTVQTVFLTGFQFYSFFARVGAGNKTYREVFMNSLSVYWYICAVYFNINMYLYKDLIRQYINTLFGVNKKLCGEFIIFFKYLFI